MPSRMSKELWSAIDRYVEGTLLPPDPVLEAALQANAAADPVLVGSLPEQAGAPARAPTSKRCVARSILFMRVPQSATAGADASRPPPGGGFLPIHVPDGVLEINLLVTFKVLFQCNAALTSRPPPRSSLPSQEPEAPRPSKADLRMRA
jgi:hypothetical protein